MGESKSYLNGAAKMHINHQKFLIHLKLNCLELNSKKSEVFEDSIEFKN
jgi:hypothetical protein